MSDHPHDHTEAPQQPSASASAPGSAPPSSHRVVDLVDAGVPADQGLSSLGLLMQLAGNLLAAYASLYAFMLIFQPGGGEKFWLFAVLGLSVARSMLQRAAGGQLLYGDRNAEGKNRLVGIRRYVIFALIQTVAFVAIASLELHFPTTLCLAIAAGLAVWPVALAVMLNLPRFKRFADDLPLTEDKGFEGASILMTVLGLCGAIGTGTVLLLLLDLPGKELQRGPGVLIALALAMLVVRSVIHVQAGVAGLRETSVDRSVELANRYANFGVISSFCGGGAMMLFVMSSAMSVLGLAWVSLICWMLLAWPMIIRRFYSDRQFADLLAAEQAPIHRRAPDAGLTSLGWLLVCHALFTASFLVPQLLLDGGSHAFGGEGAAGFGQLSGMFVLAGTLGFHSLWWSVGLVALQAWAGYELVRMSPHSRVITTVFGAVGVAVTGYLSWPLIEMMRHSHGMMGQSQAILLGPVAFNLIIPVASIILVNRKIAPTARARFRERTAAPPAMTPPAT